MADRYGNLKFHEYDERGFRKSVSQMDTHRKESNSALYTNGKMESTYEDLMPSHVVQ